jgi:peptidyl-prolyl cis-trans isomerase C
VKFAVLAALLATSVACQTASSATPPPEEAAQAEPLQKTPVQPVAKDMPEIVARVNGEPVERWEIETALKEIESMTNHPILSANRDGLIRNVLDRIIAHHLVAQEARLQKLTISDATVDADLTRIRRDYPSQKAFDDMLVEFGTTMDHLRKQTRLSLEVAQFVRTKMTSTAAIADGEFEAFYRDNIDQYKAPETVDASHILVRVYPDASPTQREEARAKAGGILQALRGGADFAELATQMSQDDGSAKQGGALGSLPRGSVDAKFEAAVFALKSGELSEVVETKYGFHVIRANEHLMPRTAPLSEVKADIEKQLKEKAQQTKLATFLQQAKANAKIEIFI